MTKTICWIAILWGLLLSPVYAEPANVILFIGDGMDDTQLTMARNYLHGSGGQLVMDQLPERLAVQVQTVNEQAPNQAVYVADSANSATAMATGVVTSRGRIATTAGTDKPLTTIVELAQAKGLRTGIVSTAAITDATPAAFASHINVRACEGPENMSGWGLGYGCRQYLQANNGAGSIAEQLAVSDVDVLLGGGRKFFEQPVEAGTGQGSVVNRAERHGYHYVTKIDELQRVPTDVKVLGLFADRHIAVKWRGSQGGVARPVKDQKDLQRMLGSPMACEANPEFSGPSLAQLTSWALQRLSESGKNKKGFFLMVESASIDKQAHGRLPCGQIGELEQMDQAVAEALEFAKSHPNTLILVTADHGQSTQIIPTPSMFQSFMPTYTPGRFAVLQTREGGLMGLNYATNNIELEEHTGTEVPLLINQAYPERLAT